MSFGKKCKEVFDKAADAIKDTFTPQPQLQPIPVRVKPQNPRS